MVGLKETKGVDSMNLLEVQAGTSAFDFSTLDLSALVPTMTSALSVALPVCLILFGIKKGVAWFMSFIKRA